MCLRSTGELPVCFLFLLFIYVVLIIMASLEFHKAISVVFHPWAEHKKNVKQKKVLRTDVTCLFVCICVCSSQPANVCILNVEVGVAVSMSLCSFQAGQCHNDPLFFISDGPCDPADVAKLEWAKFRAAMSSKSSIQQPCDLDTCYEWETCSGEWTQIIFTILSGSICCTLGQ